MIATKWRSSVVGERFCQVICSVRIPADSPDFALDSSTTAGRIPIVGLAKSLVSKDKRFNHTKVWCTFIFIDLQVTGDCSVYDELSFK